MNTTRDLSNVTITTPNLSVGSTELSEFAKVTIILQIILMILIVGTNTIVLLAICMFHTLQDITGIFVANLALSDLITGLSMPFQIAFFYYPDLERNKYTCLLRYLVITFTCNASIYSLMCTVIDRLIAITYPLRYTLIMTKKTAYGMVFSIWIIDILFQSIPLVGVNDYDIMPMCLYELVMNKWYRFANFSTGLFFAFCMSLIYLRIFVIVRRHLKQIHAEHSQFSAQGTQRAKQNNNVVAAVVLFFHISWLPFFITELTMLNVEDVTKEKVLTANFCVFAGILNSVLNPVLYAWKNTDYRRAFQKVLRLNLSQDDINTMTSDA